MPGFMDFLADQLPSILAGNNSVIQANRMRPGAVPDGRPAIWPSAPAASSGDPRSDHLGRRRVLQENGAPRREPAPELLPTGSLQGRAAQQPFPQAQAGLLDSGEDARQGGLLSGLQNTMTSPLFLSGLGLLTGGGFGGAMRGAQLGLSFEEDRRRKAETQTKDAAARSFFSDPANLEGLPPGAAAGLRSMGHEGLKSAIELLSKGHVTPLDRKYKESQIAANVARAGYYRDGGADRTGQKERIIAGLMEEDPDLSYADAVALASRAPQNHDMRRENLALTAYRNDPSRTLEEWRQFYGLGAQSSAQPPQQPAPAQSSPPVRSPSVAPQSAGPSGVPAGARQAQDGNWYVPDPERPGKYLKVNP